VRVIGVGTRHGDDAAGLEAARRLAGEALPPGVEVASCACPGPGLVEALAGADAAVVLDAVLSGAAPGGVRRIAPEQLRRGPGPSSHGFGVAEALALAAALGRAPARVERVGIEAERVGAAPADGLSPAAERGVERAVALVRELLAELSARTAEG
jgi:hydrogenase maturation protease